MCFHGQSAFLSSVKHHEPFVKWTVVQSHFKSPEDILQGVLTEDESELEILNLGFGVEYGPLKVLLDYPLLI